MGSVASVAALAVLPSVLLARPASAGEPRFETALQLQVGETRIVTAGPVQQVLCDLGGVVERVTTPEGNGFRALAVGETTCSLQTADGVRRTFHVKVTEEKSGRPGAVPPSLVHRAREESDAWRR